MACIPVSVILPAPMDSAFGLIAETVIGQRFLDHVRRRTKGFFPGSPTQEDFQDISIGIGNTNLLILYLKLHDDISIKQVLILSAASLFKIPDLMTHEPPRSKKPSRAEFYEIKPNSPSGLSAGAIKLTFISTLYSSLDLPYRKGVKWTPDEKIQIFKGVPLGFNLEVFFHFKRVSPALIVYDICVEGDLEKIALALLIAILAIILALILKGGRLPNPAPAPIPAFA
ncbi:hypothetical protein [Methylosinus sp. LW3]|uniref:hypothetical protein n=1 Tax=Methylosinus sp. LW3 TaxID=107635 RepID=UPI000464B46F|nr:hypothetical protein [Methylosinus sp. LW3]